MDPITLTGLVVSSCGTAASLLGLVQGKATHQEIENVVKQLAAQLQKVELALSEFLELPQQLVDLKEAHQYLTGVVGGYNVTEKSLVRPLDAGNFGEVYEAWSQGQLSNDSTGYKAAENKLKSIVGEDDTPLKNHVEASAALWDALDKGVVKGRDGKGIPQKFKNDLLRMRGQLTTLMATVDTALRQQLDRLRDASNQLQEQLADEQGES